MVARLYAQIVIKIINSRCSYTCTRTFFLEVSFAIRATSSYQVCKRNTGANTLFLSSCFTFQIWPAYCCLALTHSTFTSKYSQYIAVLHWCSLHIHVIFTINYVVFALNPMIRVLVSVIQKFIFYLFPFLGFNINFTSTLNCTNYVIIDDFISTS